MDQEEYVITDKGGKVIKKGNFSEPEVRMVAKAGFRVFENNAEITANLIGIFDNGQNTKE